MEAQLDVISDRISALQQQIGRHHLANTILDTITLFLGLHPTPSPAEYAQCLLDITRICTQKDSDG